ncbi:MAG: hypothetical protein FJ312_05990 [SAR202 cluster bacterium]|nr:hypothetical protein [SAR202 cluster bacterium]
MFPLLLGGPSFTNHDPAQSDRYCLTRAHRNHSSSHADSQAVADRHPSARFAHSRSPGSAPHADPEAVADADSPACSGA